jgi:hypothetical protein
MSEDIEAGIEAQPNTLKKTTAPSSMEKITVVSSLDDYDGASVPEKIDAFIAAHGVSMISKTWCPFCLDVKGFLGSQMGVKVFVLEVDQHPQGGEISTYVAKKTGKSK